LITFKKIKTNKYHVKRSKISRIRTRKNKEQQRFLPLLGTDYVEFYVGNAKQSAHYYKTAFGISHWRTGLETGVKTEHLMY
jgi:hypothetical protein